MFEQSFLSVDATAKRAWPVAASLAIQFSLLSTAVLIPLVNPGILPQAGWAGFPVTPPAPRPETRRKAAAPGKPAARRVRSFPAGGPWFAPRAMPRRAVMLEEEEPRLASGGDGVIGAVPGLQSEGPGSGLWQMAGQARFAPPPPPPEPPRPPRTIPRLVIGGGVQQARLVYQVTPLYPPLARQARIEGRVVFQAVISAQGLIESLRLVEGHPLLAQAAADAVRQWRYRPTLLNGEPCVVDTVIEVKFTLNR